MATSMDVNTETSRNFHGSTKVSNTANSDFRCRQICPVSHLDVRVCDVVKDVSQTDSQSVRLPYDSYKAASFRAASGWRH